MPVSIRDLRKPTKDVEVDFGGVIVTISYSPHWFTLAIEDLLNNQERSTKQTLETFLLMVGGWDLVDDDGQPVPVTEEAIRANNVPLSLLRQAVESIWLDLLPGKTSANGSSPGSAQAPARVRRRRGTA